jgi:hypothetical protein
MQQSPVEAVRKRQQGEPLFSDEVTNEKYKKANNSCP